MPALKVQPDTTPIEATADLNTSLVTTITTIEPPKPLYEDDDLVAVMHGPYTGSNRDRHSIDGYDFLGGVCRRVPYGVARKWEKGGKVKVIILPADATEADFLKHSGVSRIPVTKLVAQLLAADVDAVFAELGASRAAILAQQLADRLVQKKR